MPLRLQDFTGALGGPVRRNRTFFFLSYQRAHMVQPFVWLQAVPSLEARAAAADFAQPLVDFPAADAVFDRERGRGDGGAEPAAGGTAYGRRAPGPGAGPRVTLFARYNDAPSRNEFGGLSREPAGLAVAEPHAWPQCPRHAERGVRFARQRVAGHRRFYLEPRRRLRVAAADRELFQ